MLVTQIEKDEKVCRLMEGNRRLVGKKGRDGKKEGQTLKTI